MSLEAVDWAQALLSPAAPCPAGLSTWNGSDPARRFAVYRNNVICSLVDGLAAGFPVVQALVGEEFFRAMAAIFVRSAPPTSPVLAHYGAGFAEFIAAFTPAGGLPYLSDLARLELAWVHAFNAADAPVLSAAAAGPAMACAERAGELLLDCHPSWGLVRSAYPIVSLWAAHQPDSEILLSEIDLDQAEAALVLRPVLTVKLVSLTPELVAFAEALGQGLDLSTAAGAAAAAAARFGAPFDLVAALSLLMAQGALSAVRLPCTTGPVGSALEELS